MSSISHDYLPTPLDPNFQTTTRSFSVMALVLLQNPFKIIIYCAARLNITIEEPTNGNAGWYTPPVMNLLTILGFLVVAEFVGIGCAWIWRRVFGDLEKSTRGGGDGDGGRRIGDVGNGELGRKAHCEKGAVRMVRSGYSDYERTEEQEELAGSIHGGDQ